MPKKKKRTVTSARRPQRKSNANRWERFCDKAQNKAKNANAYERFLGITSDDGKKRLDETVNKHGELIRDAIYLSLYGDMPAATPDGVKNMQSHYFCHNDTDVARETIGSAVAMQLSHHSVARIRNAMQEAYQEQKRLNLYEYIDGIIPDNARMNDVAQSVVTFHHHAFDNHITGTFYSCIDWDKLLPGKLCNVWAKNIIELYENIFDEEQFEVLSGNYEEVIITATEYIADALNEEALPAVTKKQEIAGYTNSVVKALPMQKQHALESVRKNFEFLGEDALKAFEELGIDETKIHAEPSSGLKRNVFITVSLLFAQFQSMELYKDVIQKLLTEFYYDDIIYAAFKLTSVQLRLGFQSVLSDILYSAILALRMITEGVGTVVDDAYPSKLHHINLSEPRQFKFTTKKSRKNAEEALANAGIHEDLDKLYASPWMPLVHLGRLFVDDGITVDISFHDLFRDMGFDNKDAYMLCAYIEAARRFTAFGIAGADFLSPLATGVAEDTLKAAKKDGVLITDDDKRPESELEKELKAAKVELARFKSKSDKQERALNHTINETQAALNESNTENASLKAKLKRLESERNQLQASLTDLSLAASADIIDTLPEHDNETSTLTYPSPIGEDMKIVSFGGTPNWVNEMQQRFPNISFYSADDMPNTDKIKAADAVFINAFVISHKYYYRVKSVTDPLGQKLFIYPSKGANNCSDYIAEVYNDLKAINNEPQTSL